MGWQGYLVHVLCRSRQRSPSPCGKVASAVQDWGHVSAFSFYHQYQFIDSCTSAYLPRSKLGSCSLVESSLLPATFIISSRTIHLIRLLTFVTSLNRTLEISAKILGTSNTFSNQQDNVFLKRTIQTNNTS